jgi:hypothetical protein
MQGFVAVRLSMMTIMPLVGLGLDDAAGVLRSLALKNIP